MLFYFFIILGENEGVGFNLKKIYFIFVIITGEDECKRRRRRRQRRKEVEFRPKQEWNPKQNPTLGR